MLYEIWRFPSVNKETCTLIPFRKPTWGIGANDEEDTSEKIKATWLGHACFLLELPSRSDPGVRGVRILFDPVFSERCSPSQWLGPKRYTRESLGCSDGEPGEKNPEISRTLQN